MGNSVICGKYWGKIKALINDQGVKVRSAITAVKILGLTNVPGAGEEFEVLANDREAKRLAEAMQEEERQLALQVEARLKRCRWMTYLNRQVIWMS